MLFPHTCFSPPAERTFGVSLATNGLRQCAGMFDVHIRLASRSLALWRQTKVVDVGGDEGRPRTYGRRSDAQGCTGNVNL